MPYSNPKLVNYINQIQAGEPVEGGAWGGPSAPSQMGKPIAESFNGIGGLQDGLGVFQKPTVENMGNLAMPTYLAQQPWKTFAPQPAPQWTPMPLQPVQAQPLQPVQAQPLQPVPQNLAALASRFGGSGGYNPYSIQGGAPARQGGATGIKGPYSHLTARFADSRQNAR